MATNKLTVKSCETAAKGTHFDGEGLYLFVRPDGKKYWHMACYLEGEKKLLSFGPFPKVSLEKARKAKRQAQSLLAENIDPVQHKKIQKQAKQLTHEKEVVNSGNSFEQTARRLYETKAGRVTQDYRDNMLRSLELHLFPSIGKMHIAEIKGKDLLNTLTAVLLSTYLVTTLGTCAELTHLKLLNF